MAWRSGSIRVLVLVCAVAVGLSALAWSIWSIAVADLYDRSDPELALLWNPSSITALLEVAEDRMSDDPTEEDLASVEKLAARALLESPLSSEAVRTLGYVFRHRGDEARAHAMYGTAARRSWYDTEAQLLTAGYYFRTGDLQSALYHVDGLARARSGVRDEIFPVLFSLAVDPQALTPLADVLATSPSWRTWFLQMIFQAAERPLELRDLVSALQARSAALTSEELRAFLQRLLTDGHLEEAYSQWVEWLPTGQPASPGDVYNGGFEYPITGTQFDWVVDPVPGASVETSVPPDAVAGRALRVQFTGRRVVFRHLTKTLLLGPGQYRLTVRGRADDLRSERGLLWHVSCLDRRELGKTAELVGDTEWLTLEATFGVPASRCAVQQLQLQSAARLAVEQEISGEAWFDDVSISPADPPPASTAGAAAAPPPG
jgi:hypothetical protein